MFHTIQRNQSGFAVRAVSALIAFTFFFTTVLPPGYAQTIGLNLPLAGSMVNASPAFVPVLLKGMTVHPDNPLQFDFILDSGNTKYDQEEIRIESQRLVKYFLASMTVPHNDLWVNLSPYEKDRIIPEELGKTELGRDLLAQDYMLKQLTATFVYPEHELGKKFWDRIHKTAKEQYGLESVPTDVFNKVWILPETATVYEHKNTVYIVETHLKVMLDEDYIALQKSRQSEVNGTSIQGAPDVSKADELSQISKTMIREVILPEIEREVNQGKNFAPLRQIYHSLILAKWYKQTVKNSLMSRVYIDQNKTAGIEINDAQMKDRIYEQYMDAYKKGVFNYIKEDYDQLSNTVIPRQYFSGGFQDAAIDIGTTASAAQVRSSVVGQNLRLALEVRPETGAATNASILSGPWTLNGAREFLRKIKSYNSFTKVKLMKSIQMIGDSEKRTDSDEELLMAVLAEIVDKHADAAHLIESYLTEKQIVDGYINALRSSNYSARGKAAEALGKLGDKRAVDPLLEKLSDNDSDVRQAAAEALGKLGAAQEQMVEGYINALQASSYFARKNAAQVLGNLGDKRAVDPLLEKLSDKEDVRKAAAEALGKLGDKRAVDPLIKRLSEYSFDVRQSVEKALGKLGATQEQMVEGYINALQFSSDSVRINAAHALGNLGDKRAVDPLIKRLSDDWYTFVSVEVALGKLGATQEQMVNGYLNALQSPSDLARKSAAQALGKLGATQEQMVEGYINALQSSSYSAGGKAAEALKKLGATQEQMVEGYINALRSSSSYQVRINAAKALRNLGDKRAVDPLLEKLSDEEEDVRQAAAEALGKLGDERAIEPLVKTLSIPDSSFYYSAVVASLELLNASNDQIEMANKILKEQKWREEEGRRGEVVDSDDDNPYDYGPDEYPRGTDFAPRKGASRTYAQLQGSFIDELELGLDLSKKGAERISQVGKGSSQFSDLLTDTLTSLGARVLSSSNPDLIQYWNELLTRDDNRSDQIVIRVSDKLLVNSSRYFNKETGRVEIVFSKNYVDAMISHQKTYSQAVEIILSERLFHELGHSNHSDHLGQEEAALIEKDLSLYKILIDSKAGEEVSAFYQAVKPLYRSGYYFASSSLIPMDIESARKHIQDYVEENVNSAVMGDTVNKLLPYFNNSLDELNARVLIWQEEFRKLGQDLTIQKILEFEPFRVTDEKGNYTGEVMPRELVHGKIAAGTPVWHRTAGAFIVDRQGNVLFQERGPKKKIKPGANDVAAGGHMGLDEPANGMLREIEEEVFDSGYNIDPSRFFAITKDGEFIRNEDGKENASFFIYFIESNEKDKIKKQDEEVGKLLWYGGKALDDLIKGYKGYVESSPDPYAAGFIFFEHTALKNRLLTFAASLAKGDSLESAVAQADLTKTDVNSAILADNAETVVLERLKDITKFIPSLEQRVRQEIGKIDRVGNEFVISEVNGDDSIEAVGEMREEGLFISYTYSFDRVEPDESIRSTHAIFVPVTNNPTGVAALNALSQEITQELKQRGIAPKSITEEDVEGFVKLGISQAQESLETAHQRAEVYVDTGARTQEILNLSFETKKEGLQVAYEMGDQKGTFLKPLPATGEVNSSTLSNDVGGIDMNTIELDRQGEGEGIQFDMTGMEPLLNMDIQGFVPVIIDIVPINSVLPILGLADPTEPGIKFGTEEIQNDLKLSSVDS